MSKGHVHAELMAQYAEDAKETDRPWERWEVSVDGGREWKKPNRTPMWGEVHLYRRKPTQVRVAGEVFEDVVLDSRSAPETVFYVTATGTVGEYKSYTPTKDAYSMGRVHTTYSGALRHLEALKPKVL